MTNSSISSPHPTPSFIKGLDLNSHFFSECVQPLLATHFPTLEYSAARIGHGSDVLGFDTAQSMDHDWGPKMILFLREDELAARQDEIDQCLRDNLPHTVRGFTTNYGKNEDGTSKWEYVVDGPINHEISFYSVRGYFLEQVKLDPTKPLGAVDWLLLPTQILRMVTVGRVFYDGLDELVPLRERLAFYPRDVWVYLMACQWRRISQEEHFMGRCGQVGDELGSRMVAQRLVMDMMRLCFLIDRQYAPYIKWFGSAFAELRIAPKLLPIFTQILDTKTWTEREVPLLKAYTIVAELHNDLGVTEPLSTETTGFYGRPFRVIFGDRFADALYAKIEDEQVLALPRYLGGIDQFVDSTDVLSYPARRASVRGMYGDANRRSE